MIEEKGGNEIIYPDYLRTIVERISIQRKEEFATEQQKHFTGIKSSLRRDCDNA